MENLLLKKQNKPKKTFDKRSVDDLPLINIHKEIERNNIVDLVVSSNLIKSKSEVRRTIKNKGIKL